MRIVLAIAFVLLVGWGLRWVQDTREAEVQKRRETPRSEKFIAGNLDRGKIAGAQIQAHDYKQAFTMFKINKGKNPASLQELIDANYLPYGAESDPFGQKFELVYQAREAIISSPGQDRIRGTPDDIVQKILVD